MNLVFPQLADRDEPVVSQHVRILQVGGHIWSGMLWRIRQPRE
jgi:hypothetical protein